MKLGAILLRQGAIDRKTLDRAVEIQKTWMSPIGTILMALGLVNSRQLRTYRRHAVVAALVVGMVLTPPDVFSQLLMSIPLMILYELCIWAVWLAERQRERQVAG